MFAMRTKIYSKGKKESGRGVRLHPLDAVM